VPLNSDAFSMFLQWDEKRLESLKEVSIKLVRIKLVRIKRGKN
jgi:hypothetical protein